MNVASGRLALHEIDAIDVSTGLCHRLWSHGVVKSVGDAPPESVSSLLIEVLEGSLYISRLRLAFRKEVVVDHVDLLRIILVLFEAVSNPNLTGLEAEQDDVLYLFDLRGDVGPQHSSDMRFKQLGP